TPYTGSISITQTTTVRAMAAATGMSNSGVVSAIYTISQQTVATPVFSPAGGTYVSSVTVSITDSTAGASIYYTTDGSAPTTSSTRYAGPIQITQTTTVRAMATANGMADSGEASATYTILLPVATPAFSPAGGTYVSSVTVSITDSTAGASIYY